MKHFTLLILFSLLPVLVLSQPVKERVQNPSQEIEEPRVELSKADLVAPVMARNFSNEHFRNSMQRHYTEKPGLAFLSSAILPGSGQMINNNWIRGSIYAVLEVATIYFIVDYNNRGRRGERRYQDFADQNWSVAQYAQWLLDYHDNNGISNPHLQSLRNMVEGLNPAFDTSVDWKNIDIDILRNVERNTPFIRSDAQTNSGANFSHILPAYGSQQYYELISKYFQFQAGWADYYQYNQSNNLNPFFVEAGGGNASPMFFRGASLAEQFNDNFKISKNLKMLLIANHVISAFDSFFTFKLKQNKLQATTSTVPSSYIKLTYQF